MRRSAVILALLGSLLLLAGSAGAGEITGKDKTGDVKVHGLAGIERSALDIRSVRLFGDKRMGYLVDVTFKGDIARHLGVGGLMNAGVGLIVRPESNARPTGLYTSGPGALGHTLHNTMSNKVGSFRYGSHLDFFVRGSGYENIRSFRVETFQRNPFVAPPSSNNLTAAEMSSILAASAPADIDDLADDLDLLNCAEVKQLIPVIDDHLDTLDAIKQSFGADRYLQNMINALEDMRADAEDILRYECGPEPTMSSQLWWDHVNPGVSSNMCAELITKPAWSGAMGSLTVTGPGVIGSGKVNFTFGSDGTATPKVGITQFGTYDFSYSATDKGKTITGHSTLNVTSAAGSKPCP